MSTAQTSAVPKKTPRKTGFSTVTLIACIAAMPAASGSRASARITKLEKAENARDQPAAEHREHDGAVDEKLWHRHASGIR